MVESNPVQQSHQPQAEDQKQDAAAASGGAPRKHAHFDEAEIAAYDAQRGQCQPIDDPKTPFAEEVSDEEMNRDEEQESA